MARLMPSFTDDRTPPGERDVFNYLSTGPADWTAIHSLDLSPWNKGLRTEVDFVVIVPDIGILCIEVKSHQNISFDGKQWHPSTITRSPFKQALDGSKTFSRQLCELQPAWARVPVVQLCIFPRARFDIGPNISVRPWELIDYVQFAGYPDGAAFCFDLRERMLRSITADRSLPRLDSPLHSGQVDEIADLCVPVQRWRPDKRAEVEARARDAELKLRVQQRPILKLAAENSHLVVSGGAGTGKTLTAIELATRFAESGQRVGLFCFNRLVGDWIAESVKPKVTALPRLIAGSATQTLCRMTGISVPTDATDDFFQTQLPDLIDAKLKDEELLAVSTFDVLIIDEAQDIFARPHLRETLLRLAKTGPDSKIIILGDFENQVLGDREEVRTVLEAYCETKHPVRWRLDENCRNYQVVGDTGVRLAGFRQSIYSAYVRGQGARDNIDIQYYETADQQSLIIKNWLERSIADGYRKSEITLLSFNADAASAATRLRKAGVPLQPAYGSGTLPRFSSVHAFKGMESKVVILTDVDLEPGLLDRSLLYTGVTRATEQVRIACSNRSTGVLTSLLDGGGKP